MMAFGLNLEVKMTSELFCAPDADVSFISSDNVIFELHSTYFKATSEILEAPEDSFFGDEAAPLPECAKVLEILFQFIEPPSERTNYHQPSVVDLDKNLFFDLAEAAEKYMVYGAMNTCLTRMTTMVHWDSFRVLNYAARHGYKKLADDAAESCLEDINAIKEAVSKFTAPGILPQWASLSPNILKKVSDIPTYNYILYYNMWKKTGAQATEIFANSLDANGACHVWPRLYATYLRAINTSPSRVHSRLYHKLEDHIKPCKIKGCDCHATAINSNNPKTRRWTEQIRMLEENMPKFSSVVNW